MSSANHRWQTIDGKLTQTDRFSKWRSRPPILAVNVRLLEKLCCRVYLLGSHFLIQLCECFVGLRNHMRGFRKLYFLCYSAGRVQHESHPGVYNQVLSTADMKDASAVAGVQKHKEVAAPLDRKDVHVQGSLKHLDQEEKADADLQKFHSNTLRQDELDTSITVPKKRRLSPQLRQALTDMIDLRIYGNVVFAVFSIASFLAMIAFYVPFLFVPDHAVKEFQIEKDTAAWLISGIGLANIFGRLFWGWLADRPRMDPLVIHNCCILIVGIVLVFIPLCRDYISLMVVCAIFGFFVCKSTKYLLCFPENLIESFDLAAPYISLMSIILTKRIPLDQLPSAFGQSQLVRGVAAMIGAPIGGISVSPCLR